ncbi:MAG: RHS repeat-associated core domain-containing protein [Acidobacteriota bacterium]
MYAGNKLIAQQSTDGQFYWLHTNHLNSARAMTDTSGTLVYKGQFDPYGQALSEWSATGNTNLNTKKFTGYERDAATGLDYANARMYHSARGRFATPDPLGMKASDPKNPQSLNRYAYTQNDPVNFVDKSGMFREAPDGNNGGSPECRSTFVTIGWIERDGPTGTGFLSYGFTYTSCINSSGGMNVTVGESDKWGGSKEGDLDLAKAEAKRRLESDECAKLFGGKDKALEAFDKIKFEYGNLGLPKYNAETQKVSVVGAQTFSSENPPRVVINEYGPFRNVYTQVVIPGGTKSFTLDFGTGLRNAEFASLLLLHELGHVNSSASGFKPDGDDSELNRQQTQKVLDACFKK